MTLVIVSPVAGRVVPLSEVPDPVFAQAIVGPGVAVEPDDDATDAVAPISGTIAKLHPHASVIGSSDDRGVLAHLGIDTVQLEGQGFTLHAGDGDTVTAGQLLTTWSPADVRAGGRSAIVPVIAMQAEPDQVTILAQPGTHVAAGDPLMQWTDPQ
ncbi:MAG: PTS glucose transporter subunit IIA [Propionibacteriaceae bacterium]|jgi:PTS system N-acetylglucosamine-specific IIA component|nr:PTS glucose transporter subunit IIA [Propionibacteriaceae bacterium]